MNDLVQTGLLSLVMVFFVWRAIRQLFPATYRRLQGRLLPRAMPAAGKAGCDSGCGPCSGCGSATATTGDASGNIRTLALKFHPPTSRAQAIGDIQPTGQGPVKPG